jgi:Spy/CpxP family protein refolding chaperone
MRAISSILLMFVIIASTNAQPGLPEGREKCKNEASCKQNKGIPGLTEEQAKKIDGLRIAFQKEMLPLKNQMGELKAKQRTLTTAEKADLKAINANIDEITKLQNQMMKMGAEHKQQVRAILNDEQRLRFDSKPMEGKGFKGMHNRRDDFSGCKGKGSGSENEGMGEGCPNKK